MTDFTTPNSPQSHDVAKPLGWDGLPGSRMEGDLPTIDEIVGIMPRHPSRLHRRLAAWFGECLMDAGTALYRWGWS